MKSIQFLLSIFITSLLYGQSTIEWVKSFDLSSGTGAVTSSCIDNNGNIFVVGHFTNPTDFDPGPGTMNITPTGYDGFVCKYDSSGNFLWAKSFDGGTTCYCRAISVDAWNNIILTGRFQNNGDFDPGPGIVTLNASGTNTYVLKLNNNGGFIWAKSIDSPQTNSAFDLTNDSNGNIYVTGHFMGPIDFDPGPGVYTEFGSDEIYILKLDSAGNFGWVTALGTASYDQGQSVSSDNQGNIYVLGKAAIGSGDDILIAKTNSSGVLIWQKFLSPDNGDISVTDDGDIFITGRFNIGADFDPGPSIVSVASVGGYDAFILSLDSASNFNWVKTIGASSDQEGVDIKVDNNGNSIIVGNFFGTVDFNPGIATLSLTSQGFRDVFITKFDNGGNLIWAKSFGGQFTDNGKGISLSPYQELFVQGSFSDTVDFDPGIAINNLSSATGNGQFLLKLPFDSCDNLTLVIDSAMNVGCANLGYASAFTINAHPPYNYSWNTIPVINDSIANISEEGFYSITVYDDLGCNRTSSVIIDGPDTTSSFDLNANLISTEFRPGFHSYIWLDGLNENCIPVTGQLKIVLDNLVSYNYASPLPDSINGDTLIWNFSSLTYDSVHITPQIDVSTMGSAVIGDSIHLQLNIVPTMGDVDPANNMKNYVLPIVNGYDPNDKNVYPQGVCNAGFVLNNQALTYSVRFQNTGNSNAINIYILDTIDSNLDINTVRILGNSHSMITEVLSNNVLKFKFDSIFLPDSNSNEPSSHGYVIFEVMPNSAIVSNSPIQNTSNIYFDFNPPVTTNTVNNVIVNTIPNSNQSIVQTECNSILINGYVYDTTGIYVQYLDNHLGCDSVLTINLTINDSSSNSISTTSCNSYTLNSSTYFSSGTYYQTLLNSEGCDSVITLNLTITNVDNSFVQSGYTLTANQPFATYQWIDCNNSNLPISGETNQSFTASANGNYAVILNANGCIDTSDCQTIFGFGLDNSQLINGISIIPNPTHSLINITSLVELVEARLTLTDINGQILMQKNQVNGKSVQMDLSVLSPGMYFIHLYMQGKEGVIKVLKY